MSFPLSKLKEIIRELIRQELAEASTTGAFDGGEGPPRTPYAFTKKGDEKKKKKKMVKVSGGYELAENRYYTYKNDPDRTPKVKIGQSVKEIRDAIKELDRVIAMNVRLKKEMNVDSRQYWKRTHKQLQTVSEKLITMAQKLGQLYWWTMRLKRLIFPHTNEFQNVNIISDYMQNDSAFYRARLSPFYKTHTVIYKEGKYRRNRAIKNMEGIVKDAYRKYMRKFDDTFVLMQNEVKQIATIFIDELEKNFSEE